EARGQRVEARGVGAVDEQVDVPAAGRPPLRLVVPLPLAARDALLAQRAAKVQQRNGRPEGRPRLRNQWHVPRPESVNDPPAAGINSQAYPPRSSVSLSTPYVSLFRASMFGAAGCSSYSQCPPVPTVNCRMPFSTSSPPSGSCGA